jgi:hypothetical protein
LIRCEQSRALFGIAYLGDFAGLRSAQAFANQQALQQLRTRNLSGSFTLYVQEADQLVDGGAMPTRQTMTAMFGGLMQRLHRTPASEEDKRETAIAKMIAIGFGLLWPVVIWFTVWPRS